LHQASILDHHRRWARAAHRDRRRHRHDAAAQSRREPPPQDAWTAIAQAMSAADIVESDPRRDFGHQISDFRLISDLITLRIWKSDNESEL
jgi:hypothetical protein